MSYHRSMGQVSKLAAQKTGTVSKTSCPPEMVGQGFVWVPPAGGKAGFWRRAKAGECGQRPPDGMERRVRHPGGITEVLEARGGQWVRKAIIKSPSRKECEEVGIPEPFLIRCVELRDQRKSMKDVIDILIKEAEAAGGSLMPGGAPAPVATAPARFPWLLVAGGAGVVGLVLFLRRRKARRS